jgi:hypothetical protein
MIRYTTALICILLFSLSSIGQGFHPFAFNYGDRRIAFKDSTMLIVGGSYDGSSVRPCYWKNDKKVMLGDKPGYVNSILIKDNNIYMSGFVVQDETVLKPCYWKNDSLILLPGNSGLTFSITINNSDIYIAGTLQNGYENYPCYWKNGKLEMLSEMNGMATSVFVSKNDDLYFAGSVGKAVYWRNGEMIKLSKTAGQPLSILVSENDIYVAGSGNTGSKCWKNNEKYKLEKKGDYIFTIREFNGDIYVGGCQKVLKTKPCFWKNGELNKFNDTSEGNIISIEEHNSDIYFLSLGVFKDKLEFSYWVNGEKTILEN